jgi:hypothetical protein
MPDLERWTDDLREHLVKDPVKLAYERGFTDGKQYARIEFAITFLVLMAVIMGILFILVQ